MTQNLERLLPVLKAAPVVPVLIIEDFHTAIPLARALVAGGLTALEVTLRTASALDCIRAIKGEVEGANVGAGTILNPKQFDAAVAAGSTFLVSPGASPKLLAHASGSPVPLLPGIATAGEAMTLLEEGYGAAKFFPAEQAGGASYIKALASPLPGLVFCPTGGVGLKNAHSYLSLPNVVCVGGSWVAPAAAVAAGDWAAITALAKEAAALGAV
ncbi:keto-deoxy-phosphogluconate aldolase [Kaistia algarum]|uniref:2-dehydro-3-deoxy-phosphogluconate aldolase n=1 Tax=Kaistia algarum TaxID=2083279 RepID=UPI000CE7B5FE|nr:2-dehydro-3-deoxy-phosphogluconate aldolase [Kaistia algarum]MCX5516575.1 2-dehydro-3-deoxy-phosphogluconate aldolase [Kaistia algarum]PPE77513.1 keto-deoxy-phosphogluconate aldolase [Kaistia algarum]